jgi:photosystem II stability/assembly factor-like uncharacterized protein
MKKIFGLVLAIVVLSSIQTYAQGFNSVTSPDGIYAIAVGDDGLMYRTSNGGNSWAGYIVSGVDFKDVTSFGDNVWFTGANGSVYKTLKNNSPVTSSPVSGASSLNGIFFLDNTLGFACGADGKIFKSTDGGDNWAPSSTGIPGSLNLTSISFKDANNGVVVGDGGAIYTTANGGTSWTSASSPVTKNLLDVKYFTDGYIAVGEYGTLVVKPTSLAFDVIDTRIQTDIRGVTGLTMNTARICGGGGFIRSNVSSPDFYKFEMNPMMANLVDISYATNDVGFAVSSMNKAIIKTTNGGVSWTLTGGTSVSFQWQEKSNPSSSGIGNTLCMHPTDRDAMFVVYGSTVYVSRNRGETWSQVGTIAGGGSTHSFYVSPLDTNVWIAAITSSPDRVTRSTNYGATWTTVVSRNFSNYGQPLEMDQNDPNYFYFAPDGGDFYVSSNGGANFSIVSNYNFRSPCDIIVKWDDSQTIFVGDGVTGSGQAQIIKSTNRGVNWTVQHTAGASEIPSMCNTVFAPEVTYATEWSGSTVYRSTNSGNNWSVASNNSGSGWASDICREDPTLILTGNYGANAWLSTNNGATFPSIGSGLSSGGSGAGMMVPERGYLINMQTGKLFKLQITYDVITTVEELTVSTNIPDAYSLQQNYPNPFNPSTKIRYDIAKNGIVKLTVYDQLGRQVSELVNGTKNAGTYEVEFNGSNLASGIYFYKLEVPGQTFTKKMILVK